MMKSDFRVFLFDNEGRSIGELCADGGTLDSCTRSEELNGEHSLSITTTKYLNVGTRALTHHKDGRWREWVVDEPSETHEEGDHSVGTYHLCWSLQYDLQSVYGSEVRQYGMGSTTSASTVMNGVFDGTIRWRFGTTDVTAKAASIVFNTNESAWDRLNTVVKRFGGEIDVDISVNNTGVTSRRVNLFKHVGSERADRRLEWDHNLTSITRIPDPGPYFCRVIPQGNGETEDTDDGESTYQIFLEIDGCPSYSDGDGIRHDRGSRYLRDTESELLFRVADGQGGYEYPTTVVSYSTDDEDELFELAKADMLYHTRPNISYTGDVANFGLAGMDTDELGLGDEVQIVDMGFNVEVPLRTQERIIRMEIDELGIEDAKLSIGQLIPDIERNIATIIKTVGPADIAYNAPIWDATNYTAETPELSTYEIQPVDAEEPYLATTYEQPTLEEKIEDLNQRVQDTEVVLSEGITYDPDSGIYMPIGISADPAVAGIGGGGDGWIHMIDGVEYSTGTVNFSTVDTGGGSIPHIDTKDNTKDSTWGTGKSGSVNTGGSGGSGSGKKATTKNPEKLSNAAERVSKNGINIQTAGIGNKNVNPYNKDNRWGAVGDVTTMDEFFHWFD